MDLEVMVGMNGSIPGYATEGSLAFDIAAAEDHRVMPFSYFEMPTDLVFKVPKDHALLILPRSSLFKKYGAILTNSIGLIDYDFCGFNDRVKICLYSPMPVGGAWIRKGDRIAQGLLVKCEMPVIVSTEWYEHPNRGGIGSTGD